MPTGVYERTPETCAILSKARRNSDAVKSAADAMRGISKSPEHCANISAATIGVPHTTIAQIAADKAHGEKQRGGFDIVNHHWLYDHADLTKYTMPMTRSEHSSMHNAMRKDNYKVPHINNVTDDNGLWGYKSW